MLRMQIKNILQTHDPRLGNSHFGNLKVPLHREIEIGTVIMAVTTSLWTLRKKLTLEAVISKAVVSSNNSIKAHHNIKVKVADKNSMPPLSTSSQHLTLETTIISKILATLPTAKSCSLPSKIGSTKDSRVILTTVEVDKVAEIGVKTTKEVVKVEVMVEVMAVVEAEVADVVKAISIIMIVNKHPTRKTTRRSKNRLIKSTLQKKHAWKHLMLMRLSKS